MSDHTVPPVRGALWLTIAHHRGQGACLTARISGLAIAAALAAPVCLAQVSMASAATAQFFVTGYVLQGYTATGTYVQAGRSRPYCTASLRPPVPLVASHVSSCPEVVRAGALSARLHGTPCPSA